jgi:hypothetical protein
MKDLVPNKLFWYQSAGFLAIIGLSWIDECLGLHQLILGNNPYISDFRESALEMLLILGVWFIVAGSTRRLLAHVRHLESFMKVCAWCRHIEYKGRWMPLEEFLEKGFETRTSHGICKECLEKRKSEVERANHPVNASPEPELGGLSGQQIAKHEC